MQEMSSLNDEHDENAPLIAVVPERSVAQPNKARRLLSKIAQPVVGFWDFLVRGSFVQLATAVIVGGAFNDAGSYLSCIRSALTQGSAVADQ
jgi:hypothetical protein